MTHQIRKAKTPELLLIGNAGHYAVLLGKHELGRVSRASRRTWQASTGLYARTARGAAQHLLLRALSQ